MAFGNKQNVHVYDNVSEYLDREKDAPIGVYTDHGGRGWDDGVSPQRALKYAREGHPGTDGSFAADVADLESVTADDLQVSWFRSTAGSRVCIPEYLSGAPDHMRQRRRREVHVRHLSIYVSLVCSGGITSATMLKRGATILAYLDYLQRSGVNVDLFLVADMYGDTGDHTQVIRVESRPLNLSQVGFVIAHPAFTRHVTYGVGYKYGFNGSWSNTYAYECDYGSNGQKYADHMRERLGMQDHDVFIPPVFYYDNLIQKPQVWLKERIAQLKEGKVGKDGKDG
jgi:hypothetical protein